LTGVTSLIDAIAVVFPEPTGPVKIILYMYHVSSVVM
jgi:hypothetical protein